MEEYSDIFVWQGGGGGKRFDSYDFGATISDFEDRVALSGLQPALRENFTASLSAIRETLSRLDQGDSRRHEWEETFEATLKAIEEKGLDEKSANELESEVEELKQQFPAVTGERSRE